MKKMIVGIFCACLVTSSGIVFASNNSVPGDALFSVKVAIERARLGLVSDPDNQDHIVQPIEEKDDEANEIRSINSDANETPLIQATGTLQSPPDLDGEVTVEKIRETQSSTSVEDHVDVAVQVDDADDVEQKSSENDDDDEDDEDEKSPDSSGGVGSVGNSAPSTVPVTPSAYTLAQVTEHGTASSCWSVVNNGVYDFTGWINKHPGGASAILGICGKDSSTLFNVVHAGSSRANAALADYKIGNL